MRSLSVKKSESVGVFGKPLKRLARRAAMSTGLKAGVNEMYCGAGPLRIDRRGLIPLSVTPAFKPVLPAEDGL
jgi:hypothetical protein